MNRRPVHHLLYALFLLVSVTLLLELATRAYFATQVGARVLAYGTPSFRAAHGAPRAVAIEDRYDVETAQWNADEDAYNTLYTHEDAKGGYVKFFPHEAKFHKDPDTGEWFPITVNSRGFRGPEFSEQKPAGVIRVLTLGASSTVGLWNRDHDTYPHQLEDMLNERCDGARFEVINFAIPHAVSDQIRSMFLTEGLALDPDVVTFYEGRNDSARVHPVQFQGGIEPDERDLEDRGAAAKAWAALAQRLLVVRFVDEAVTSRSRIAADTVMAQLDSTSERVGADFITDLDDIRTTCVERGIAFIPVTQQANSLSWYGIPAEARARAKGVTYADEVEAILARVRRGETISGYEFNFLIHDRLMQALRAWAVRSGLPLVDGIALLDQDRDHLVSWVHLDSYANQLLASALADEILRQRCPAADAG